MITRTILYAVSAACALSIGGCTYDPYTNAAEGTLYGAAMGCGAGAVMTLPGLGAGCVPGAIAGAMLGSLGWLATPPPPVQIAAPYYPSYVPGVYPGYLP